MPDEPKEIFEKIYEKIDEIKETKETKVKKSKGKLLKEKELKYIKEKLEEIRGHVRYAILKRTGNPIPNIEPLIDEIYEILE